MLSKSKHFVSLSRQTARLCLNSYNRGVTNQLHNACCSVAEPIKADDTFTTDESPELPNWVKVSDKDNRAPEPDDEDFVPPSLSYWIDNHKFRVQEIDMKTVVNDIVESDVDKISKILKNEFKSPDSVVEALKGCDVDLSKGLVDQVLRRFSHELIPSFGFFNWSESQMGVKHSPESYNLMVDNLGKARKFEIMWEFVEKMKTLDGHVTLETMTKIMRRLVKAVKYDDAIETFEKIEGYGVDKDMKALDRLMESLVREGSVEHAERVFFKFKKQIPPTLQTYNKLVYGWCRISQIDKAKKTVDEMKAHEFRPDLVTYTNFIEAYCREKDFRKVDDTLEEMKKDGLCPSVVTYTKMLKAYTKAKEINKAFEIYEQMKENNYTLDGPFYSVFITALSQAGRLQDSDAVFEDMSKQGVTPNVSTYNTLIYIYAFNLQEEKALSLLMKMEENNCKPNIHTYMPLLKMCCILKRMKVLSFLLNHMFKNDVSIDPGTYSLLVSRLCKLFVLVRF